MKGSGKPRWEGRREKPPRGARNYKDGVLQQPLAIVTTQSAMRPRAGPKMELDSRRVAILGRPHTEGSPC